MSDNNELMKGLLENFAQYNFPKEKFEVNGWKGDWLLEITPTAYNRSLDSNGHEQIIYKRSLLNKISIDTIGTMIADIDIPNEIIKDFSKMVGVKSFSNEKYHELFKSFVGSINANEKFKSIFEPLATDLDKLSADHLVAIESYDSNDSARIACMPIHFTLYCKINKKSYPTSLQAAFKFTKDNTIKPLVVFNIIPGSGLTLILDIKKKCIRKVTENSVFYEDYMSKNKALKGDCEIDDFCNRFAETLIEEFENKNKDNGVFLSNSHLTVEEKLNFIHMNNI